MNFFRKRERNTDINKQELNKSIVMRLSDRQLEIEGLTKLYLKFILNFTMNLSRKGTEL